MELPCHVLEVFQGSQYLWRFCLMDCKYNTELSWVIQSFFPKIIQTRSTPSEVRKLQYLPSAHTIFAVCGVFRDGFYTQVHMFILTIRTHGNTCIYSYTWNSNHKRVCIKTTTCIKFYTCYYVPTHMLHTLHKTYRRVIMVQVFCLYY